MRSNDGVDSPDDLRTGLVDELQRQGHLQNEAVAAAFLSVPRHVFLPQVQPEKVYRDQAFGTKFDDSGMAISSSTQPAIMADMLEQLDLHPGHRVLEVGAGTGYNAALIADIVGPAGQVTTVDIDEDIVEDARAHLAACGLSSVRVACGDGSLGWPDSAPYDRIVVTAASWDLAPAWSAQLVAMGRLVLPLQLRDSLWPQASVAFERANGHLRSRSVRLCGFMALRGGLSLPSAVVQVDGMPGLFVEPCGEIPLDPAAVGQYLRIPRQPDVHSGVFVTERELMHLRLWLALREPATAWLVATKRAEATLRELVPRPFSGRWEGYGIALVGERGLAALSYLDQAGRGMHELGIRPHGPEGEDLARRLIDDVRAWNRAGRLGGETLSITALSTSWDSCPRDDVMIEKRNTRLCVRW